jgi:hypothetical protein
MKAANAGSGKSCRDQAMTAANPVGAVTVTPASTAAPDEDRTAVIGSGFSPVPKAGVTGPSPGSAGQPPELSVRAENVLKELAVELTGEIPPQGRWIPSGQLLQKLIYRHLATARNCGPQTTAEIIEWARARGKTIRRPFHSGKSLSTMWQDVIARFSTGEISKAEVAEALENSTRRRNTRIPVEFQRMLLQLVRSSTD